MSQLTQMLYWKSIAQSGRMGMLSRTAFSEVLARVEQLEAGMQKAIEDDDTSGLYELLECDHGTPLDQECPICQGV